LDRQQKQCDYWGNNSNDATAILIVWDDWGGWYDHKPPATLPAPQGGYQLGFRVPFIAVSAYTPVQLVDNNRHDFGSIVGSSNIISRYRRAL